MKVKKILLTVLVLLLLFLNICAFAFSFNGFGYPTSTTGVKTGYITQGLGQSKFATGHLGEDYSMPFGANVYSIADGEIFKVAKWKECPSSLSHGWGGVVIIKHEIPKNINKKFDTKNAILKGSPATSNPKMAYSVYAHLKNIKIKEGQKIKKGTKVGKIGKVCYYNSALKRDSTYGAHLHFEIKDKNSLEEWESIGRGYSGKTGFAPNRYIPSKFIENNKNLMVREESKSPTKKAKSAISKIVKKIIPSKKQKPSEGAIIPEKPLSLWERFFVYRSIVNSDLKELFGAKTIKETKSQKGSKRSSMNGKVIWNQKFSGRDLATVTYIMGEKNQVNRATFQFKNTGNTLWRKKRVFLNVIGGYNGVAAKFYHRSWESKLRSVTFEEETVGPGELATFKFTFSYPLEEGTYFPQFILSRHDGEKWVKIGKDRAVFVAKVKNKNNELSYFSANIKKNINGKSKKAIEGSLIKELEIKNLEAINFSNRVVLLFSPPQENISYEVYVANQKFNNKDFQKDYSAGTIKKLSASSKEIYISKAPFKTTGGKVKIEIDNLNWLTHYFFAVRAKKDNQYSKLSNVVSLTTDSALALSDFPMFHSNPQKKGLVSFVGPGQNYKTKVLIEGESRGDYDYDYFSTPSIDSKGNIYFTGKYCGNQGVYSLTKERNKRFFVPGNFSGMPILFESENLVFAIKDQSLIAANIKSGKIVWEKTFNVISNDEFLIIDDYGRLYFIGGVCIKGESCFKEENGRKLLNTREGIFSLDPKTGKVIWFFAPAEDKKYKESEIDFKENLGSLTEKFSSPAVDKKGNIYFGLKNSLYGLSSEGDKIFEKLINPSSCDPRQIQWNNTHIGSLLVDDNSTLYFDVVSEKYEGCGSWSEGWRSCVHALNTENLKDKYSPICASQYAHKSFAVDKEGNLYIAPAYYCASCGGFAYSYLSIFNQNGKQAKSVTLYVSGLPTEILVDSAKNVYALFSGVYSNPLIILPNGSTDALQLNLKTGYPYYSDKHISISEEGTLYLGSKLRLYAIEPTD